MYYLTKYQSNLFDRAGEELKEAFQGLKSESRNNEFLEIVKLRYSSVGTFTGKDVITYESAPINQNLFNSWREIISDEEYLGPAAYCFAQAWVGAANYSKREANMPTVLEFEDVRDFLIQYNQPIWGDDYTTEALMKTLA